MSDVAQTQSATDPLLVKIWDEIQSLGLQRYIAELDVNGYTVIPPELASPNGLAERLLEATLQVAERRNGERPDLATGSTHANHQGFAAKLNPKGKQSSQPQGDEGSSVAALLEGSDSPIGDLMQSILLEDPVFEEALLNPVLLALATYLCGYGVILNSMGCFMKGPNNSPLPLHSDTGVPSPLPPYSLVTNLTWALTEFNRDNGSTAVVPGSHKWCRAPVGDETKVADNPRAVAIEAAPGSLICWHGNTWHGAFNRTAPGLRVSIPVYMARPSMRTQEGLIGKVPEEILQRNPARFAILTQQGIGLGWDNQANALSGAVRAAKFQQAWQAELGVPPAQMHPGSLFA